MELSNKCMEKCLENREHMYDATYLLPIILESLTLQRFQRSEIHADDVRFFRHCRCDPI